MYYILVGSERSLPLTVALALALRDGLPLALASTLSRGRRVRARSPCGRSLAVPGSAGVLAAPFCTAAVCGAINGSLGYCESPHGVVIALALALALAPAPGARSAYDRIRRAIRLFMVGVGSGGSSSMLRTRGDSSRSILVCSPARSVRSALVHVSRQGAS